MKLKPHHRLITSICRNCGKQIECRDGRWVHSNGVITRHHADPMTMEDQRELEAGQVGDQ